MIERLFPAQIDNAYAGFGLAIWLLIPIVAMKLLMGLNVAGLNPWVKNREIMTTADGIPIESYSPDAASTAVFLFACWGLALFVLSLLGVIVLVRYRAMIPLMYLLLAIEQIGRKGISWANPIVRSGSGDGVSAGALINWGLSAALIVGLALSLTAPQTE